MAVTRWSDLSIWFVLLSTLGFTQVMGRYGPQFVSQEKSLQKFFGRLLTVRLGGGALAAGLYLLLTVLWLRDLDPLVLALSSTARLLALVYDRPSCITPAWWR